MGYTHLTPTGTPGRSYSFSAKTEATAVLKGFGLFSGLSVLGTPGKIHTFTAKTLATAPLKGIGPFTRLSVLGVPGRIHSFSAKTAAEILDFGVVPSGGGGQAGAIVTRSQLRALGLQRDDQDALEFIVAFVLSRR